MKGGLCSGAYFSIQTIQAQIEVPFLPPVVHTDNKSSDQSHVGEKRSTSGHFVLLVNVTFKLCGEVFLREPPCGLIASHCGNSAHTFLPSLSPISLSVSFSLPQVTSGFKSKSMAAALPPPFLDPLFSISLMEDSELRQLVLEILHNIIDRHDNRAKLRGIRYREHVTLCIDTLF